jgi:hypothetical protein
MYGTRSPREIALATYRGYNHGGGYDTDRLSWTLDAFLPSSKGEKSWKLAVETTPCFGCWQSATLML